MWGTRISAAQRATRTRLYGGRGGAPAGSGGWLGHDRPMLDNITARVPDAARRRVQAGLWMFFAGAAGLLLAAIAQLGADPAHPAALVDRFPAWPTWFVPESAAGYTAAVLLVCWGVWSLGAGLRLARDGARR